MSSNIKLTRGKSTLVDDSDYEWLNQYKWFVTASGYAARAIGPLGKQKFIYMHKLILNCPDGKEGDHKNRNPLDNRRKNLRIATRSQNMINTLKPNKTGFRGVQHRTKNSWRATIRIKGKYTVLGHFDSAIKAALAYNRAAKKHHGEFARLNHVVQ